MTKTVGERAGLVLFSLVTTCLVLVGLSDPRGASEPDAELGRYFVEDAGSVLASLDLLEAEQLLEVSFVAGLEVVEADIEWELVGSWWLEDAVSGALDVSEAGWTTLDSATFASVAQVPLEAATDSGPECGILQLRGEAQVLSEPSSDAVSLYGPITGETRRQHFGPKLYLCREDGRLRRSTVDEWDSTATVERGWVYDDADQTWLRVAEADADAWAPGFMAEVLDDDPEDADGPLPYGYPVEASSIDFAGAGGGAAPESSCSEADTVVEGKIKFADRRKDWDESKHGARYPVRTWTETALRHAVVEIWDKDSSTSDDFLGYSVTGPDGVFEFEFNWCELKELHDWTETRPDIYTKVHLVGVLPYFSSYNWNYWTFVGEPGWDPFSIYDSPRRLWEVYRNPDTATILAFTGTVLWNAQPGGPHYWGTRLYELWGYTTSDYSEAANGFMITDFFWEMMATPDGGSNLLTTDKTLRCYASGCAGRRILQLHVDDSYDSATLNRQRIELDSDHVEDPDPILHELGHVFEKIAEQTDSSYANYNKDGNPFHGSPSPDFGDQEWESAVLSEGWAEFFQVAVQFRRDSQSAHLDGWELEDEWDCSNYSNPHFYVGFAMMAFWDFYDSNNDGDDNRSHTLGRFWATWDNSFPVFESGHRQPNIFDWWERYDNQYSDANADDAETLLVQNCLCGTAQALGEDDDTKDVCP